MLNVINGPKGETPLEKRLRDIAEMKALWEELDPEMLKGQKHLTLDEVLDCLHQERATGEGFEKLWEREPTLIRGIGFNTLLLAANNKRVLNPMPIPRENTIPCLQRGMVIPA
jgi:hypothetical protein